MAAGDEPKKPTPSVPPDRAAQLARKLTGRSVPPALGRQPTNPPASGRNAAPPLSEPPPVSKRDEILAARRASLSPPANDLSRPGADRPPSKAPPPPEKTRKAILALGAVLLLAALIAGGLFARQALYERSDEGRVVSQLLAWEFTPSSDAAAREAAFAEIDRMGGAAINVVINKLTDASLPERGSSHSSRPIQLIAHLYLVSLAAKTKAPPPPAANDVAKLVLEGANVPQDKWVAARDAWRAWVTEQQAKGAVPK